MATEGDMGVVNNDNKVILEGDHFPLGTWQRWHSVLLA